MRAFVPLLACLLMLFSCQVREKGNLIEVASQGGSFSLFVEFIDLAGYTQELEVEGPFTLFAPHNRAFAHLTPGQLEALRDPDNRDQLRRMVAYHIVRGALGSRKLRAISELHTLAGENLTIDTSDDRIEVNNATIIGADLTASNGIIHILDSLLTPSVN